MHMETYGKLHRRHLADAQRRRSIERSTSSPAAALAEITKAFCGPTKSIARQKQNVRSEQQQERELIVGHSMACTATTVF